MKGIILTALLLVASTINAQDNWRDTFELRSVKEYSINLIIVDPPQGDSMYRLSKYNHKNGKVVYGITHKIRKDSVEADITSAYDIMYPILEEIGTEFYYENSINNLVRMHSYVKRHDEVEEMYTSQILRDRKTEVTFSISNGLILVDIVE